jgi:hypothetical protein
MTFGGAAVAANALAAKQTTQSNRRITDMGNRLLPDKLQAAPRGPLELLEFCDHWGELPGGAVAAGCFDFGEALDVFDFGFERDAQDLGWIKRVGS